MERGNRSGNLELLWTNRDGMLLPVNGIQHDSAKYNKTARIEWQLIVILQIIFNSFWSTKMIFHGVVSKGLNKIQETGPRQIKGLF